MTAWHLACIRSTNFVNRPTGIHFHASFKQLKSCCSLFTTLFEHTRSRMGHRFSMGFRPGDWAGLVKKEHFILLKPDFCNLGSMLGIVVLLERPIYPPKEHVSTSQHFALEDIDVLLSGQNAHTTCWEPSPHIYLPIVLYSAPNAICPVPLVVHSPYSDPTILAKYEWRLICEQSSMPLFLCPIQMVLGQWAHRKPDSWWNIPVPSNINHRKCP